MSDPNSNRIAIKFGSSSSSSKKPNPPSSLGKRPRSHALGGDSDSEHDDDEQRYGKHEVVTGFGADGAAVDHNKKKEKPVKKEYVIERMANRDWKSELKANRPSRNGLPPEARQNGATKETEAADQDKQMKWGLTVKEKKADNENDDGNAPEATADPAKEDKLEPPVAPRTADEEAVDALLGKKRPSEERVIQQPVTEDDAYQRDVDAAGAMSTLEDYEAMPVEEFGAALLRGMGWDGKSTGSKRKEVKRRPNRLGLGAKELNDKEDLGGWNQGGGKKRPPRLNDYRREEAKRKEARGREDSYKREREREREREHGGHRSDRHHDRHRDRDRRR